MQQQISQQQMIEQAVQQKAALERRLKVMKDGQVLLTEAQRTLRADEVSSPVEKALDLLIGYNLGPLVLSIEEAESSIAQLEAFIRQASSPIQTARLVVPK